ncbi:MAG: class I SAM-dependent methyltransferase [Candidatus Woesearchaeota archaeon]|jgi:SAM-dependent methyltransferase
MAIKNRSNLDVYEKHYNDPIIIRQKNKQAEYFVYKTHLNPRSKTKFFEPGCGIGVLGSFIKKRFKVDVFGMELSNTAILKAKKNGILVKRGDLNKKWPYESNTFDYVISSQVIEHILDTDNFVKEIKRILKSGGTLCLSTPNLAAWFNRVIFLFGYQPFFTEISNEDKTLGLKFTRSLTDNRTPLGHIRVFTLKGLIDILEYHGFEIECKYGGEIEYLPNYMKTFDKFFSNFPYLASDLFVVARKK